MNANIITPVLTQLSAPIQLRSNQVFDGQNIELTPAPGYTGPAIQPIGGGFQIDRANLRGFRIGIDTSLAKNAADGTGESMITRCRIYDSSYVGINWDGISDGLIEDCIVANTKGYHSGTQWLDFQHQVSEATGLAGIRLGKGGGGTTISKCHVWGNTCWGILNYAGQSIIDLCRVEGGRLALILLSGWNITVTRTCVWNVLENLTPGGSQTPAIAPALQLGHLNKPGTVCFDALADDPSGLGTDYKAAQCDVELKVQNFQPMFPMGLVACDHEDNNLVDIRAYSHANSPLAQYAARVGVGPSSKFTCVSCS